MIILVGLMGSGKSTIGKLLAPRLHLKLVDLDDVIVKKAGKTIPQIFNDDGEQLFRHLEAECLAICLQHEQPQVIATGGGAILSQTSKALLSAEPHVIWVHASPEILVSRITGDSNRPLLNDVNPLEKMQNLALQRNPIYADIAKLKIDTDKLSDKEAVAKIIRFLSDCAV